MKPFFSGAFFLLALFLESVGFGLSFGVFAWLPLWSWYVLALSFEAHLSTLLGAFVITSLWLFLAHPAPLATILWLGSGGLFGWLLFRGVIAHRSFLGTFALACVWRLVFGLVCYGLYWRGTPFFGRAFLVWIGTLLLTDSLTLLLGFRLWKTSYVAR